MEPLDSKSIYYSPESVSNWPLAIRYGSYCAAVGVAITLIGFLTNTEPGFPSTPGTIKALYTLISLGATIWFIRAAIIEDREKNLGGYIEFGRIFGLTIKIGLVSSALGAIFNALYANLINPGYAEALMSDMEIDLERQGMTDDQIEMAMSYSKMLSTPAVGMVSYLIMGLIISAIIGLIAGAIMKRPPYQG
jgi:hypothetical protein